MPLNQFTGICNMCQKQITAEEAVFGFDKPRNKTYYRNRCKPCQADYQRERYNRNVVGTDKHDNYKQKSRRNHIKQKYGLSWEEYETKLANGCQVCGSKDGLCVDHDHTTRGEFRGILCGQCNTSLGMMRENPMLIRKLADYIENNEFKPASIS